jgi:hypothetical protein
VADFASGFDCVRVDVYLSAEEGGHTMSLVFLLAFLFDAAKGNSFDSVTYEYMVVWALFAIADALWFRKIKWWEDKDG